MGMFDWVIDFDKTDQVKLWGCTLHEYEVGDEVPSIDQSPDYSVRMPNGMYINVEDNIILNWNNKPRYPDNMVDKWGATILKKGVK